MRSTVFLALLGVIAVFAVGTLASGKSSSSGNTVKLPKICFRNPDTPGVCLMVWTSTVGDQRRVPAWYAAAMSARGRTDADVGHIALYIYTGARGSNSGDVDSTRNYVSWWPDSSESSKPGALLVKSVRAVPYTYSRDVSPPTKDGRGGYGRPPDISVKLEGLDMMDVINKWNEFRDDRSPIYKLHGNSCGSIAMRVIEAGTGHMNYRKDLPLKLVNYVTEHAGDSVHDDDFTPEPTLVAEAIKIVYSKYEQN